MHNVDGYVIICAKTILQRKLKCVQVAVNAWFEDAMSARTTVSVTTIPNPNPQSQPAIPNPNPEFPIANPDPQLACHFAHQLHTLRFIYPDQPSKKRGRAVTPALPAQFKMGFKLGF